MKRIAGGSQKALRALYGRYGRLVHGMALRVLGDESAAEEVTQDVFLRVWEKAGTYSAEMARLSTWLMRIARNRAIDVMRQRGSIGARAEADWDDLASVPDSRAPDPGEDASRSHCAEEVRRSLAGLPVDQRHALGLAFFKGLTHQGIAETLGEPLGTVKTRIRDAMRKLRDTIDEDCAP